MIKGDYTQQRVSFCGHISGLFSARPIKKGRIPNMALPSWTIQTYSNQLWPLWDPDGLSSSRQSRKEGGLWVPNSNPHIFATLRPGRTFLSTHWTTSVFPKWNKKSVSGKGYICVLQFSSNWIFHVQYVWTLQNIVTFSSDVRKMFAWQKSSTKQW